MDPRAGDAGAWREEGPTVPFLLTPGRDTLSPWALGASGSPLPVPEDGMGLSCYGVLLLVLRAQKGLCTIQETHQGFAQFPQDTEKFWILPEASKMSKPGSPLLSSQHQRNKMPAGLPALDVLWCQGMSGLQRVLGARFTPPSLPLWWRLLPLFPAI